MQTAFLHTAIRLVRPLQIPACVGLCGMAVLVLLAGFVPGRTGGELRLPFGLSAPNAPARVLTRPLDTTGWMWRGELDEQAEQLAMLPHSLQADTPSVADVLASVDTGVLPAATSQWVAFSEHGVNILTDDGPRLLAAGLEGSDLFQRLNSKGQGMPSGLSLRATAQTGQSVSPLCVALPGNEEVFSYVWRVGQRMPFSAVVERFAKRFKLDRELIYAIMFAESGFNPRVISNRDAHGLMQVVPGSAGNEVHTYLYGRSGQPDRSTLLNPETNIQYGITYFHLLMSRHMNGIKDRLAQEYCAVAAYNMGPNGLLRVFGPTRDDAFAAINALSSSEVYEALQKRLPSNETRQFLNKVISGRSGLAFAQ